MCNVEEPRGRLGDGLLHLILLSRYSATAVAGIVVTLVSYTSRILLPGRYELCKKEAVHVSNSCEFKPCIVISYETAHV